MCKERWCLVILWIQAVCDKAKARCMNTWERQRVRRQIFSVHDGFSSNQSSKSSPLEPASHSQPQLSNTIINNNNYTNNDKSARFCQNPKTKSIVHVIYIYLCVCGSYWLFKILTLKWNIACCLDPSLNGYTRLGLDKFFLSSPIFFNTVQYPYI